MIRWMCLLGGALLALLPLTFPGAAHGHGRDPHARTASANGWLTSLSSGKSAAKKSGKPMLVVLRCFD